MGPEHTRPSCLPQAEWYLWGPHGGDDLGVRVKCRGSKVHATWAWVSSEYPPHTPPAAFLLFSGKSRDQKLSCAQPGGEGQGLSTDSNVLTEKPQAPWSPAAHLLLEGDEPETRRRAPACPISPHPAPEAQLKCHRPGGQSYPFSEPQGTQVSLRALPSMLPDGKFQRHRLCSTHLKPPKAGTSSTETGTQQGAGLDGQRWEEERCTPPNPPGGLRCGHNSECVTPSFICNVEGTGLDLGSPIQGLWTP